MAQRKYRGGAKPPKAYTKRDAGPFCDAPRRGEEAKRLGKKCKNPAGARTDHPGIGRCWKHGGNIVGKNMKTGFYSSITHEGLKEKFEQLMQMEDDVLNLVPEAMLLRAITADFINRYEDFVDALMHWHEDSESGSKPRRVMDISDAARLIDGISRVVERIHKMRQEGAVSLETFRRVTEAMGMVVARHVSDRRALHDIEREWGMIAIDAKTIDYDQLAEESGEEWEDGSE